MFVPLAICALLLTSPTVKADDGYNNDNNGNHYGWSKHDDWYKHDDWNKHNDWYKNDDWFNKHDDWNKHDNDNNGNNCNNGHHHDGPRAPIDGGISLLLAAGIGFGVKKISGINRKKLFIK